MDSPATPSDPVGTFRTPPRILIPKLVRSRDGWKARATERKRQYRKEQIRSRDLANSRQRWKARARKAEQKLHDLQHELDIARTELEQTRGQLAQLQDEVKKN